MHFINELDELVSQKVVYDWKPIWCEKCTEFGHLKENCRAGEQRKKASKPIPKPSRDGMGSSEGRGTVAMADILPQTKETAPHPPKHSGQTQVQQPLDLTKPLNTIAFISGDYN
ncbi:unnamed protein product [Amaranthus hypochondriacus]